MKHSTKILLLEFGIILISLFCLFVFKINHYVYLGTILLLAVGLHFLIKPEKRVERFNTEVLMIIIISILLYYAITYFIGFFSGFYYTTYSKSLSGIFINVITSLIVIFSIENIRGDLIKNYAYHKSIVYLTPIICSLLEIPSLINLTLYTEKVDIFYAFITLIIPSISKNIVLTFVTYKTNKICSIVYQLLITIPLYFLPVFPNFGEFLDITIRMLFPIVVFALIINVTTIKFDKIFNSRLLAYNKIVIYIINSICLLIIILILYLTSGMFRYYSLAIGSESMKGAINKGDIVIVDRRNKNIKNKDIIAFKEQGKVIVHRVVKIKELDDKKHSYKTKGDKNNAIDGWTVKDDAVVGKIVLRVRWLGWPTIILSELLSNGGQE